MLGDEIEAHSYRNGIPCGEVEDGAIKPIAGKTDRGWRLSGDPFRPSGRGRQDAQPQQQPVQASTASQIITLKPDNKFRDLDNRINTDPGIISAVA